MKSGHRGSPWPFRSSAPFQLREGEGPGLHHRHNNHNSRRGQVAVSNSSGILAVNTIGVGRCRFPIIGRVLVARHHIRVICVATNRLVVHTHYHIDAFLELHDSVTAR